MAADADIPFRPRQVSFGGDPEAALVTFSNPAEAKAAYKCTEAVLNNRFIKVFWHNKERDEAGGAEVRTARGPRWLSKCCCLLLWSHGPAVLDSPASAVFESRLSNP